MAVVTLRLCAFENEAVVLSLDFDNTTGNVVAIRCVNTTASPAFVHVQGLGSGPAGRSREAAFPPGTNVIAIPGGQQPRFPIVVTDGVPEIGGYAMYAWWPV